MKRSLIIKVEETEGSFSVSIERSDETSALEHMALASIMANAAITHRDRIISGVRVSEETSHG